MNDLHELSGLYALDALDEDERVAFEAHLTDCPACQREVAEFRDTMAVVASVVGQDDIAFDDIAFDDIAFDAASIDSGSGDAPPPSIRSRVLNDIAAAQSAAPVLSLDRARNARSERRTRAMPAAARRWLPAAAAAVVVLAVIGAVLGTRGGGQSEFALLADLQSKGSPTFSMTGSGDARLVISDSGDRAVIVASGLAPLDDQHAYQAWTIDSNADVTPAPLFRPDASGNVVVALRSLPDDLDTIAVTIEPRSGSKLPTTPVLMSTRVV
jgi:anti-sigma-K factor RskA